MAGYWTHKDLLGGVYTGSDLLDILEVMEVKAENERRSWQAEETLRGGK
jgi:hypothetical protein